MECVYCAVRTGFLNKIQVYILLQIFKILARFEVYKAELLKTAVTYMSRHFDW
jgi:hypothetical protein